MSDIAFSFSADEKDILRALEATGKSFAQVRDEVTKLAIASGEHGTAELSISKQRAEALAPLVAKQKELRAIGESLAQQMKDGKITAEEYKAKFAALGNESNALKVELQKLQAQMNEDMADMRKATAIIGDAENRTEKYARAVADLNRLKEKGLLTSAQHAKAIDLEKKRMSDVGGEADKSGGLIGGLTGRMGTFVSGLGVLGMAVKGIKQEYDELIQRQGKARDANVDLGATMENLVNNGADAAVMEKVRGLAKDRGIKEGTIAEAVSATLSARGDFAISDVTDAVGSVSRVKRLGGASEMAGLGAAVLDTRKQTGLGTDQALGFLFQMQDIARTKSLNDLATNLTPAVGGVMKMGTDRQTSGALLAALSHGMGDATGANTANAGLSLSDQLRKFAPGQDLGKTIASLQGDAQLRQQFLAGASFEVKARPAIEGLLSGGKEAKDFAAFRQSLITDPTARLRTAEKNRDAVASIGIAERVQSGDARENAAQVADITGANSAITRENIARMRSKVAGQSKVGNFARSLVDEVRTGGVMTPEYEVRALQEQIAELKSGRTDVNRINQAGMAGFGSAGPLVGVVLGAFKEQQTAQSEATKKQIAILEEQLKLAQQQAAAAHAGVMAARANNQREGAP